MFHKLGVREKKLSLILLFIALAGVIFLYFSNSLINSDFVGIEKKQVNVNNGQKSSVSIINGKNPAYLGTNKVEQKSSLEHGFDLNATEKMTAETSASLPHSDLLTDENRNIAEQYQQSIHRIDESQAQLEASEEALLNNKRVLEQLNDEWSQNSLQLQKIKEYQAAARAAASYELPNVEEVDELLGQLRSGSNHSRSDHPTGMSPQVVNRVQETTGISSSEIESFMNK